MKLQYLFYVLGIIFIFATVAYFAYNYLFNLSDTIKMVILILLMVVFFTLGEIMEAKNI